MQRDALRHLCIARLRGRDIDPGWRRGSDQLFSVAALPRARAPEDERDALLLAQKNPARAATPSATIATPAARVPNVSVRACRWRERSAMPTVSAIWIMTRPSR